MSEQPKKRGPMDYDPLNMMRAGILRSAMQQDLVTLIHTKNKYGDEVDVLCIKDLQHGTLHPMAIMLNSIDDIDNPPGTKAIGNPYHN